MLLVLLRLSLAERIYGRAKHCDSTVYRVEFEILCEIRIDVVSVGDKEFEIWSEIRIEVGVLTLSREVPS